MLREDDPHNWTQDFSHENGNYFNLCIYCGHEFLGHKRRVSCFLCSHPEEQDPHE